MSLDPRLEEHLRYFGFDPSIQPVNDLKLDPNMKAILKFYGFNTTSLTLIENYKPLVAGLNKYYQEMQAGTKHLTSTREDSSVYNYDTNTLNLDPDLFPEPRDQQDQREALLTLSHELIHAFQSPTLIDEETVLIDYVKKMHEAEGQAMYYELITMSNVYPDMREYKRRLWEDNKTSEAEADDKNIYQEVNLIMGGSLTTSAKISALAEVNEKLLAPEYTSGSGVNFTYDETYKLTWLLAHTDLAIDFLQAKLGPALTQFDRNFDGRTAANNYLKRYPQSDSEFKVLVNKYHQYFGTDADETLHAEVNGSALGGKFDGEVLWGGGGNDELYGSSKSDLLLGGEGNDTLYGLDNNDNLFGGGGKDKLFGGMGNDELNGGADDDYLYGGEGYDIYIVGQGYDIIMDSDNYGELHYAPVDLVGTPIKLLGGTMALINGESNNIYYSEDNNYCYIFSPYHEQGRPTNYGNLNVYLMEEYKEAGEKKRSDQPFVTIANYPNPSWGIGFQSQGLSVFGGGEVSTGNNLGLEFSVEEVEDLPEKYEITSLTYDRVTLRAAGYVDTGMYSDYVIGSAFDDVIYLGAGNSDLALGQGGDDYINGGSGRDYIVGGAKVNQAGVSDNDIIYGEADEDILHGGAGNDVIYADNKERTDNRESSEKGDWVNGGLGDDQIHGSRQRDFLNGGAGEDTILGWEGDDVILGDGNIESISRISTRTDANGFSIRDHVLQADGVWAAPKTITQIQYADPVLFNWTLGLKEGADGRTDFDFQHNYQGGTSLRLAAGGGADYIDGGEGNDWIAGQTGNDIIYGGAGNDIIYGDDVVDNAQNTQDDDFLVGGTGLDKMYGGNGHDTMYSDEVLNPIPGLPGIVRGDGEADEMYGGAGNDTMYAGTGGDKLYGEDGNDLLIASTGDDGFFDGGSGDDYFLVGSGQGNTFEGGAGQDSFVVNRASLAGGQGTDVLTDSDGRWSLTIDSQVITGDTPGLRAVAENKWRVGQMEIAVIGSNLVIYAVTVDEAGVGTPVGKELIFQNAAGQAGFQAMNLPPYEEEPEPEDNRKPQLNGTIADPEAIVVGEAIFWQVPFGAFSDPDGDPLSYELRLADGSDLPDWLHFDPVSLTLTGQAQAAGDQAFQLIVSDGRGGEVRHEFGLSVTQGNRAPEPGGGWSPQTVEAGSGVTITLASEIFSDPDGDSLSYRARLADDSELPGWLSFDPATGAFSGQAPQEMVGQSLNIRVWASDGWLETETTFILEVTAASELNTITGTEGNDTLYGTAGADRILGLGGHDTLSGGNGDDILDGGAGNDTLNGGAGNDIFVFGRGYGHDIVEAYDSGGGRDLIRLKDLSPDEVEFRAGNSGSPREPHLVVVIKETGESLTVRYGLSYSPNYQVQAVEFGDGTVVELADLMGQVDLHGSDGNDIITLHSPGTYHGGQGDDNITGSSGDDILYGDEGNDTLSGGNGDDILDGGAGNDTLNGGAGNDIFVFGRGYGHDIVEAYDSGGGRDLIRLKDLSPDEVEFRAGNSGSPREPHLVVVIKETGESLTVRYGLSYSPNYQVQAVEFGDGTVVELADLMGQVDLHGSDGNDTITLHSPGTYHGGQGDDNITGSSGDDILYGDEGNDTLSGGNGDDILDGGAGNDTLNGGAGNDIFVFGRGYGHDIVEAYDSGGGRDLIRLKDLSPDEVEFRAGNSGSPREPHLVVVIKETGESLTVRYGLSYSPNYQVQAVEFGDGTVVELADLMGQVDLHGSDGNDTITLHSPGTYHGGQGDDNITGSSGDDILYGDEGNDTLSGGHGDDILDGGAGNDTLKGGAGNDIFVFGRGYGHDIVEAYDSGGGRDIIRLKDLSLDEVEFRAGNSGSPREPHLVVVIKETGESLTVRFGLSNSPNYQVQAVEFGDDTVVELADLMRQVDLHGSDGNDTITLHSPGTYHGGQGDDNITGSSGDDALYGDAGNDRLYGGAGNDWLKGGTGNDYLEGGAGNDTYLIGTGDGQDTINNYGGGEDLLKFEDINPADLWFEKSGYNLLIGLIGTEEQVTVNNWYHGSNYSIDTIEAGDYAIAETQVAQMVQALAAIGAPAGVGGHWTEEQRDELAPVLSAHWQPAL